MDAKYFYNRLLGYENERLTSEKYFYGYENKMVDIHHKNDESTWFVIHYDGTVYRNSLIGDRKQMYIDELEGNDFELFNIVQVIKCGYLVLETKSKFDVKRAISSLHHYIDSFDNTIDTVRKNNRIPVLCGGSIWENGVTEEFQYYSVNGIELDLMTIESLCQYNISRKHYDAKCFPFIKSMKDCNSIYVSFVHNMNEEKFDEVYKKCNRAVYDLIQYMNVIDVNCKYVNCKMEKPIYC